MEEQEKISYETQMEFVKYLHSEMFSTIDVLHALMKLEKGSTLGNALLTALKSRYGEENDDDTPKDQEAPGTS